MSKTKNELKINFSLLFGLKLGFSQILYSFYGVFWQCSCVRL